MNFIGWNSQAALQVCRKALLSFTGERSFFSILFYQYNALSTRAVDGHQMYSGGSVVAQICTKYQMLTSYSRCIISCSHR